MAEDIGFGRLPRGVKILWERVGPSRTLSLGFFFATGSRFDPPGKAGTAHLVEHLVFKGTKNFTAAGLARSIDRVGGDLNAWTDREEMAFTCSVPAEAWEIAVEVLTQLCLFPTFPEDEFEREKEVIRNEILATLEDPEELSSECFLQTISPGNWSRPVAGTEQSLAEISLDDAKAWWAEYGHPGRLTIAVSGGVEPNLIRDAVAVRLAPWPEVSGEGDRADTPERFQPVFRRWIQPAGFQMVQIIGGYSLPEPKTTREAAIWQVFSMLWGETMSSRLFQTIREQRGLCYSVSSQIFDTEGTWGLQFFAGCAPGNARALLKAFDEETSRLAYDPPSETEWEDARMALRGGAILSAEKTENRVSRLWRQFESFGVLLGSEEMTNLLSEPISPHEKLSVLSILIAQTPSLLVWGKVPRGFVVEPKDS